MTNLKSEGNSLYSKKDYQGAIRCYLEYLRQQHPDHKAAYFNLSQCYFNLGRFEDVMVVCRAALALDAGYHKALYRLMLAARHLADHSELMVSAYNFAHCGEEPREEAVSYLNEAREALRVPLKTVLPQSMKGFIKLVAGNKSKALSEKQYNWEGIMEEIERDYQNGVNLAYKFISETKNKQQYRNVLREIIRKRGKQKQQQKYTVKQSSQSDEDNLFGDSAEKVCQMNELNKNQQKHIPSIIQCKQSRKQQKQPQKINKGQQQPQFQNTIIQNNTNLVVEYEKYFGKLEQTPDIFQIALNRIINLLNSELKQEDKRQLLCEFKKRTPRFRMIVMGFSKNDRFQLKNLLLKNHLQTVISDYVIGV